MSSGCREGVDVLMIQDPALSPAAHTFIYIWSSIGKLATCGSDANARPPERKKSKLDFVARSRRTNASATSHGSRTRSKQQTANKQHHAESFVNHVFRPCIVESKEPACQHAHIMRL